MTEEILEKANGLKKDICRLKCDITGLDNFLDNMNNSNEIYISSTKDSCFVLYPQKNKYDERMVMIKELINIRDNMKSELMALEYDFKHL